MKLTSELRIVSLFFYSVSNQLKFNFFLFRFALYDRNVTQIYLFILILFFCQMSIKEQSTYCIHNKARNHCTCVHILLYLIFLVVFQTDCTDCSVIVNNKLCGSTWNFGSYFIYYDDHQKLYSFFFSKWHSFHSDDNFNISFCYLFLLLFRFVKFFLFRILCLIVCHQVIVDLSFELYLLLLLL